MSDFIASNLHKKVDHLMDIFFGAGVASHPTIIEQINYLLFMRALSQKDDDLRKIGVTDSDKIVFDGELEKYHWDNLLTLNAEQLFIALEECFRKIPESTTNRTVRLVFRNAHIKLFDKPSLRTVVHELDAFAKLMDDEEHQGKRDIFGDTYEYLLSKLSQAGTSGQFRTPRHIIEFLVAVIAPKKGETILDPAVGTAGFLVKAFEYLRREYTSPEQLTSGGAFDKLSGKEHSFLYEHTFSGFDSDEDMIKFGMMNLYLHGLQNAKLVRQNTLTDTAGSRDKYDVILANPPFSGKIDRDSVAEELQMNTGATEVLFLNYMIRHLTDVGRMGVIVPEGVLFNSSGGHSKIRQQLIDNGLWCVVSLPSGVFNPYSGVKTSIIFLDKEIARKQQFDRVIFLDINSDGYSLGSQRRFIGHSDLDNALVLLRECYKEIKEGNIRPSSQYYFPFQDPDHTISIAPFSYKFELVTRAKIAESKNYSLNGGQYLSVKSLEDQKYDSMPLSDLLIINPPKSEVSSIDPETEVSFVPMADLNDQGTTFTPQQTRKLRDVKSGYTYFRDDDVLLAKVTPCFENGKAGIARNLKNGIGFGSSEYYVLRATDQILPEYLCYYIKDHAFRKAGKRSMTGTGGLQRIPKAFIQDYKIPLPPIEIQKAIVKEIESKQVAIDHAREIIKTLERERAYFDPSARALKEGWPIVRLSDIFANVETGVSVNSVNRPKQEDEFGILKTSSVTRSVFIAEENKAILKEELRRAKTNPRKNSIIISRMNTEQLVGASAHVKKDHPDLFLPDRLWQAGTDRTDVSMHYISLVIAGNSFRNRLSSISGGTSGSMKNISKKAFLELTLPLPPIEIQNMISAQFTEEQEIIDSNRKLINISERKIAQTLAEI